MSFKRMGEMAATCLTCCLTCAHWRPKDSGSMARHGFAICSHEARWTFFALTHTCNRHQGAPEEVAQARIKWNDRRRK
jgi:hypothetical protein